METNQEVSRILALSLCAEIIHVKFQKCKLEGLGISENYT